MEAKGCAKPAVWREARRYFYWALRHKIILSSYLEVLVKASPSLSRDNAAKLLFSLLAPTLNSKDNRAVAEALENLDLESTIAELRNAEVTRQVVDLIRSPNRKAALAGFVNAASWLTDEERSLLQSTLGSPSADHSPGTFLCKASMIPSFIKPTPFTGPPSYS
jgi:acetyl-CoA carboxylase/biotin carboxylase 1